VLRQKLVGALVIENGVAAAQFQQKPLDTRFEGFGISGEERRRTFLRELNPRVVANSSNINVILKYVLSDCTQNLCSFTLA
jgi:hypothetical protein